MQLQFIWTPYETQEILMATPEWVHQESRLWTSVTSLLCFPIVEWHQVDRVLRQFGAQQPIPGEPLNIDGLIGKDARGHAPWWPNHYGVWYNLWAIRQQRCIMIQRWAGSVQVPSVEYFSWYCEVGRRILTPGVPQHTYLPLDAPVHVPMVHVPPRPDHVPDTRRAERRSRVGTRTRTRRRQPRQDSPDDGDDAPDAPGDDGGPPSGSGHQVGEPSTIVDPSVSGFHQGESSTQGEPSTQPDYQFQPQFHTGDTDLLLDFDTSEDMTWAELYRALGWSQDHVTSTQTVEEHRTHEFDLNAPPRQPSLSPVHGSSPQHAHEIPSFDLLGGTPPSGHLQQGSSSRQAEEQQPEEQQHRRPVRDIRPRRCYTGGHIGGPIRRRRGR